MHTVKIFHRTITAITAVAAATINDYNDDGAL